MRFYGDMSDVGRGLGQKLGLGLSGAYYNKGYQNEASGLSDMATARYRSAQAKQLEDRMQYQNPEFASKLAGIMSGLAGDQSETMRNYLDTGSWGETPNYSDAGPVQPQQITTTPSWATPEKQAAFRSALASGLSNLLGTGDSKANDIANANAIYQKIIAADEGMSGGRDLSKMAQAFAAVSGKGPYSGMTGGVYNQFSGQQNLNPIGQSLAAENYAKAAKAGREDRKQNFIGPDKGELAYAGSVLGDKGLNEADSAVASQFLAGTIKALTKRGMSLPEAQSEAMNQFNQYYTPGVDTPWYDFGNIDTPARFDMSKSPQQIQEQAMSRPWARDQSGRINIDSGMFKRMSDQDIEKLVTELKNEGLSKGEISSLLHKADSQ